MIYIRSVLWSFTYPVTVLAGQAAGYFLGVALYFIYNNVMFLNLPELIVAIGPTLIAGLFAGWLAGVVITKFAGEISFPTLMILPALLTAFVLAGNVIAYTDNMNLTALLADGGANFITLGVFVLVVRGHKGLVGHARKS
jgi:hypothetical protein